MDNYRQEKLGEVEDTFREFGTSLSQEKIEEIGEWYILEIEKLKKENGRSWRRVRGTVRQSKSV